ncbi:MAG: TolC family protein [Prevotellaceae bacterium]|nr:TolC family protein [Prevotellaceae bacterium]
MNKFVITALILFLGFSTLEAQPVQWKLEDCILYAIEHNISIKQIELQTKNAEIEVNTSQMSRLPNLNAGLGQNWNFGRTQTQSGLYENQSQSNTSLSISSSMPLFTGFRIPNEIEKSKLELQAATQNLEKAKEDLSLNIASLFLQVLFNKEILKINRDQLELSQSQTARIEALVDAEKAPVSQMYDIEAQIANDRVSVIQAENNLKLSLLDLAQSLELENSVDFDVAAPEFDIDANILLPHAVFDNAVEQKPVIKELQFRVESAERTLKIAKSGYLPSLSLSMGYSTNYFYLNNRNYVNRSFADQFKNNAGEYIGLNLNIPIFNRFTVRNQVRSAQINIENQQLSLENAKKTLYKEIQTAYMNAVAAQEKYRAAGQAVKSTQESFKYAREKYEAGKSSIFEFNEIKTRFVKSQSEEVQAKYDYIFRTKILDFYNGIQLKL